jgi:hypothetical protein
MRPIFFRAFAAVTLPFAFFLFFPAIGAVFDFTLSPWQSIRTLILFSFVAIVALGLLLRKWSAIYFSVPLFVYGIGFAWTAIEQICFPFNLLGMLAGAAMMLPFFVTIRVWRQLKWGGRWFF